MRAPVAKSENRKCDIINPFRFPSLIISDRIRIVREPARAL